ncbi:hypothetical protein [Fusobacterium polymorphum]
MNKIKLIIITVLVILIFSILYYFVTETVDKKTQIDKAVTEIFK